MLVPLIATYPDNERYPVRGLMCIVWLITGNDDDFLVLRIRSQLCVLSWSTNTSLCKLHCHHFPLNYGSQSQTIPEYSTFRLNNPSPRSYSVHSVLVHYRCGMYFAHGTVAYTPIGTLRKLMKDSTTIKILAKAQHMRRLVLKVVMARKRTPYLANLPRSINQLHVTKHRFSTEGKGNDTSAMQENRQIQPSNMLGKS
jgi:hypothetical protein